MTYRDFFQGKKVTVLGLGLLGRGVGDVAFIAECGAQVVVTDKKTEAELAVSVAQLRSYPQVTFKLGAHDLSDVTSCDMVIKAAGVPLDSPEIAAARAAGVPVYMSTALAAKWAREAGAVVVGVTGTRGKSTVTHLIHHVVRAGGMRVHLGGNIRGMSTLALIPDIQAGDILVLELDSWQLQGFGELSLSPHISVFTNLMSDHQNYYPDMESYFADKAQIFKNQRADDVLICGRGIVDQISAASPVVTPRVPEALPNDWRMHIPGVHNRENAAFAVEALRALRIDESIIRAGLESFPGVEGRLQFVREVRGVKIYNDNNATTPEATIAGLRALAHGGSLSVILIVGGADKGLDVRLLAHAMEAICKKIVLLSGTGTDVLLSYARGSNHHLPLVGPFSSLETAVAEAFRDARAGDVMLFSPAFASFGMFKNEYDRGDQFLSLVHSL